MKKIDKAKVKLVLSHPFFASIMLRRPIEADPSCKTFSTNGIRIRYNPEFSESMSLDENVAVLAHEVLHITNLHHTRREGRDHQLWNKACDYAINPLLVDSGLKLPEGALLEDAFRGKSAEEIYRILEQDNQGGGQGGQQGQSGDQGEPNGGMGEVEDAPAQSQQEMERIEAETRQEVAEAAQVSRMAGNLPAGLERMVDEVLNPKVDWRETLARFLVDIAHNDYSWSRPNRRYAGSGFILPSLYNVEMGQVVLMVDTSGSIDRNLLNKFAAEMQDACSLFHSPIKVLYVDTEVAGEQDIDPDAPVKLEPRGGGGTDFKPGFKWLEEQGIEPKAVVYFTDMECHSYPDEPDFPVLWARTGKYGKAPFGEIIDID